MLPGHLLGWRLCLLTCSPLASTQSPRGPVTGGLASFILLRRPDLPSAIRSLILQRKANIRNTSNMAAAEPQKENCPWAPMTKGLSLLGRVPQVIFVVLKSTAASLAFRQLVVPHKTQQIPSPKDQPMADATGFRPASLVVLHRSLVPAFERFCQANSGPLPLLGQKSCLGRVKKKRITPRSLTSSGRHHPRCVIPRRLFNYSSPPSSRVSVSTASVVHSQLRTVCPQFQKYECGDCAGSLISLGEYLEQLKDMVIFVLDCSFSLERALEKVGLPGRDPKGLSHAGAYQYCRDIQCGPSWQGIATVSTKPVWNVSGSFNLGPLARRKSHLQTEAPWPWGVLLALPVALEWNLSLSQGRSADTGLAGTPKFILWLPEWEQQALEVTAKAFPGDDSSGRILNLP
ncbi:Hypothetical predicted protein [Marmota monax]|uniref:Uncharacterized protein n=1 Tax=Marmota monax TaxID=9995 RepID=A0A5E4APV9_MARMO|nr:hypothetical protein GHT09_013066 [Marmota monax]VTJ58751.1 Hypothetical predicted protein [Marmota monax]